MITTTTTTIKAKLPTESPAIAASEIVWTSSENVFENKCFQKKFLWNFAMKRLIYTLAMTPPPPPNSKPKI